MQNDQDVAVYIGLDWGDRAHAVQLQPAAGGPVEQLTLEQQPHVLHRAPAETRQSPGRPHEPDHEPPQAVFPPGPRLGRRARLAPSLRLSPAGSPHHGAAVLSAAQLPPRPCDRHPARRDGHRPAAHHRPGDRRHAQSGGPELRRPTSSSARSDRHLRYPDRHRLRRPPGPGAVREFPRRWDAATELQSHAGIAPVTERRGKALWVHHRLACPKFLKQTFHEYADQSIRFSVWARRYYDQQRGRGNDHHAALRSLAFKWMRILFRCWQDRTPYDEARYLDALRRHGSPLVERLT